MILPEVKNDVDNEFVSNNNKNLKYNYV